MLDPAFDVAWTHGVQLVAPCSENVFSGHDWHSVAAVAFEYVPAGQKMHVDMFGSAVSSPGLHATQAPLEAFAYPALHAQLVTSLDSAGDVACRHGKQSTVPSGEYVLGGHGAQ